MRWRGVHHCERCGQPTVRERLSDAARSLLLYMRQAEDAPRASERARWIAAAERMDRTLRDELDLLAAERAALSAPLKRFETADPAEWKLAPVESAPPPPEFHALLEALSSRRRMGPARYGYGYGYGHGYGHGDDECGKLPPELRALADRARDW
ncbi:MAG TPA: hypothetical protein VFF06_17555 [Polyangia bacterium]|nr:hypothetical protein [Polyangia bacterium]